MRLRCYYLVCDCQPREHLVLKGRHTEAECGTNTFSKAQMMQQRDAEVGIVIKGASWGQYTKRAVHG